MKKLTTLSIPLLLLNMILVANSVSAQEILYAEEFNYEAGELPTGWVIAADQPPEWGVNVSQIAGGTAPELYMGYGFQAGLSRLVSSPIAIAGHDKLAIRYKQYLINYSADAGEIIGLDVTFDDGATWQPLWESLLGLMNIPQDEYVYYIDAPAGALEMKFAFRYDGNNNFINGWAIDDVVVETVMDSDLVARKIVGNTTPNIGEVATYIVTIENGGTLLQDDYTVSLYNESGTVVASVPGDPIAFAQTIDYTLSWTPNNSDLGGHSFIAKVESDSDANLANNETSDFLVAVQYQDTEDIQIGDFNSMFPTSETPYDFFYNHSLTQTIYQAANITATGETMNGMEYTAYFDNDTENVSIQIYLGETTQEDMSTTWVDPSSFTLVYDGSVNFQKGLNNIYIPFDTTYDYTGDNLVVYANKSYTEQVLWVGFINTPSQNSPYSRVVYNDAQPYDAMNPPNGFPRWSTPNITLFFSSGELAISDNAMDSNEIALYPNPARDEVTLTKNTTISLGEVIVYDTTGRLIKVVDLKNMGQSKTIDISQLQSGIYFLKIRADKGTITRQLIKE